MVSVWFPQEIQNSWVVKKAAAFYGRNISVFDLSTDYLFL